MKLNWSRSPLILAVASTFGLSNLARGGTVTSTADSGPGSLRDLVAAATAGETIDFASNLNGATITLTTGNIILQGREMTIDASALPSGISLSGNNGSRILVAYSQTKLTVKRLKLIKGRENASSGGALYVDGGELTMTDCSISGCYAGFNGGGVVVGNHTKLTIDRCSFSGNEGKDFGGALFLFGTASSKITNTVISGNRSTNGGGILNLTDNPVITNCTIQGNAGEGIRNENASKPVLRNTIVWGNRAGGGSIYSQQIYDIGTGSLTDVNHCMIEDGALPLDYPQFIEAVVSTNAPTVEGNLRLATGSPALDFGDNAANVTLLDRVSRPRVEGTTIDLGAYESGYVTFTALYPALTTDGDENENGVSNFAEYALARDPAASGQPTELPAISQIGGFSYLTFHERSNAADLIVEWQASPDLTPSSWVQMQPGLDYTLQSSNTPTADQVELVLKVVQSLPARFYRQKFSQQ